MDNLSTIQRGLSARQQCKLATYEAIWSGRPFSFTIQFRQRLEKARKGKLLYDIHKNAADATAWPLQKARPANPGR